MGDTIREIINTSQKPQPELALLNTLAALGAIFGRRYASPMDTRTNLYTVGTAVTGAGKDHSRRFIKKLMTVSVTRKSTSPESKAITIIVTPRPNARPKPGFVKFPWEFY